MIGSDSNERDLHSAKKGSDTRNCDRHDRSKSAPPAPPAVHDNGMLAERTMRPRLRAYGLIDASCFGPAVKDLNARARLIIKNVCHCSQRAQCRVDLEEDGPTTCVTMISRTHQPD